MQTDLNITNPGNNSTMDQIDILGEPNLDLTESNGTQNIKGSKIHPEAQTLPRPS